VVLCIVGVGSLIQLLYEAQEDKSGPKIFHGPLTTHKKCARGAMPYPTSCYISLPGAPRLRRFIGKETGGPRLGDPIARSCLSWLHMENWHRNGMELHGMAMPCHRSPLTRHALDMLRRFLDMFSCDHWVIEKMESVIARRRMIRRYPKRHLRRSDLLDYDFNKKYGCEMSEDTVSQHSIKSSKGHCNELCLGRTT
jgi:hypothetical protein